MTDIAFRSATGKITATSGSNTAVPLGTVVAGDVMLAVASYSGTGQTLTPPTGWSVLAGPLVKGTALTQYLLQRVADSSDVGASPSFDWSSTAAARNTVLGVWSGADPTNPIPASGFASVIEATAGTGHGMPSLTATGSGMWLVQFGSDRGSPGSSSFTASGMTFRDTEAGTGGGAITSALADSAGPVAAGSVGGNTWNSASAFSSANFIGISVLLQPVPTVTGNWQTEHRVTIGG